MTRRRVVITGLGSVSSVGIGWPEMWGSLLAGKSGVGPIDHFDASKFDSRICARVKNFDPARWLDRKECKRVDRVSQFAIAAAELAREDGGLDFKQFDPNRVGVILGTGIGGIEEIESEHHVMLERGPDRMSPFTIPKLMANAMTGHLAIRFGLKGPNFVVGSACASSAHALALSGLLIRTGVVDMALSGGSEAAVTALALGGFCALRALSRRNDDPQTASRPFDKDRDGFVMGMSDRFVFLWPRDHNVAVGVPPATWDSLFSSELDRAFSLDPLPAAPENAVRFNGADKPIANPAFTTTAYIPSLIRISLSVTDTREQETRLFTRTFWIPTANPPVQ